MPWTALVTSSFSVPNGFKEAAKHCVHWSVNSFCDSEPQWTTRGDTDRHAAAVWSQNYVPRVVAGMVSAARSELTPALAPCSCPTERYTSAAGNVVGSDGKVAATVYGRSPCLHVKLRRLDLLRRYFISLDMEVEGEDPRDVYDYLIPEPNYLDGFQWCQFEFTINVASLLRGLSGHSKGGAYKLTMRVVQLNEWWPAGPEPVLLCLEEGNCRDLFHPQTKSHVQPWEQRIFRSGPDRLDNFALDISTDTFDAFGASLSTLAAQTSYSPRPSHGLLQNGSCWEDIGSGIPNPADASCHPSVHTCSPSGHCDFDVGGRHQQSSRTTFFRDLDSEVELALTKFQLRELNETQDGRFEDSLHSKDPQDIRHDDPFTARWDLL